MAFTLPAASQKHLSVHFNRGPATKLSASEVGIVWRVDEIVRQGLVHVHVDVQSVKEHWSILVRH